MMNIFFKTPCQYYLNNNTLLPENQVGGFPIHDYTSLIRRLAGDFSIA